MTYPIALLGGLAIKAQPVADTKASRILSGLLLRANQVVDGESLVEAGWFEDLEAGETGKIRGNTAAIRKLLDSAGQAYELLPKNAGSYVLRIDASAIDILDIAQRCEDAEALLEAGDTVEALKLVEQAVPQLGPRVSRIGVLSPVGTCWEEDFADAFNLRLRALELFFSTILTKTNHDGLALLKALNGVDLGSIPSPRLWALKVGLVAELDGAQAAAAVLTDAKIALTRLSVPHNLDAHGVEHLQAIIAKELKSRAGRPVYDIPLLTSPQSIESSASSLLSAAKTSAIRSDLIAECDRLLSRKITGSSVLTMREMSTNSSLRMPALAAIRSGPNRAQPISDVITLLVDELRSGNSQYLLIAPPGAGKSLVNRLIFLALADLAVGGGRATPSLIDLRSTNLSDAAQASEGRDVVLMDSLDELLASGTLSQVRAAIQDSSLESADVISCRTQFYEQFLSGTPLVEGRTVVEIRAWDVPTIERYIDAYSHHVFGTDELSVVDDLKRRLDTPSVESLLSIPLRLNMALDLVPPGENNLPVDLNSLSLHRQWVQQTLRNEAARKGSTLDADEKLEYLTTLAWRFYDEGTPGLQSAPSFTEGEIRQVLAELMFGATADELKRAARDLEFHSILVGAEQDGTGTTQFDSFEFQHKTFQEFLVARYIINAAKAGPESAASVFRQYLSPQVSDFIKDELKNMAGHTHMLATNLQQALASYDREAARNPEEIRLRSTIQQICYYLASLPLEPVREAMLSRLGIERDVWVARGIAIGLSFGGETRGLDQYIEALRRERDIGRSAEANGLNVGYHLSFFGDQPFDPLQPHVDRGLESVSATVSRLVHQLSSETDYGSWRLDLYTLIDLYRHRLQSRDSCVSTIVENRQRLNWVLQQFQSDPRAKDWPELADLRDLLTELEVLDD